MAITIKPRTVNLAHYYPNTVYPSKEFQMLADIGDTELNKIWSGAWQLMLNTFVYNLNEEGAERWEDMLKIYPADGANLYSRRRAILAKINSSNPYTERSFQNILDGIYGEGNVKVILDVNKYEVWLDVTPALALKESELRKLTRITIPANLGISVQNTKEVTLNAYFGGRCSLVTKTVIEPSVTFDGVETKAGEAHAGIIRWRKRYKV